ncbi:sigma-70 family RNA polymerase sigma factor [Shinella zoogloeoides]|uniref:sigma-70 family RNA polymerase sigma factor n=1 Tax=Shinella zoogloeoides TaxID=352475 RepID=UPI00299D02AA|nr:sigma-70 family RNA polymerase sigma factor [Shinella zoogloeoides]WPE19893.1 hypothetical protein ShzoTeo12_10690 [Shinella zoogloeoides]
MQACERPQEFDAAVIGQRRALYSFAMSMVGTRDRAEDLVQDVILKAFMKFDQFEPGSNLKAWLFTIMRNEVYSRWRKRGREVSDPDGIFAALVPVNEGQSWAYDLKVIRQRMRMLPSGYRKAAELVAVLGHEYEEAAAMLGVPLGTIKSRINRVRHFLETGDLLEDEPAIELPSVIPAADQIEALFRNGNSISEIKDRVDGATRSEIMQVILDRKLSVKRA